MANVGEKQTWLVTGSSNGIGLALVRYILSTGDNVIATSRNPAKTPEVVKEIESYPNGKWATLDIAWPQDKINQAIKEADALFEGGITAVVNNAAFGVTGAVEDVSEEDAKAEFDTNVWGTVRVCKAILQISSVMGLVVSPAYGIYCASKFALEGKRDLISAPSLFISFLGRRRQLGRR
jgi:NAD(P)-dependent dehydrogenase (short-subunit alcohol dehydrogenase family)